MKGSIGRYLKNDGREEIRIHFPVWELDGATLRNVTIFPHQCGTCVGGDHTHVEIDDIRESVEVITSDAVLVAPGQRIIIDDYLRSKLEVDRLTIDLCRQIALHVGVSPHKHHCVRVGG